MTPILRTKTIDIFFKIKTGGGGGGLRRSPAPRLSQTSMADPDGLRRMSLHEASSPYEDEGPRPPPPQRGSSFPYSGPASDASYPQAQQQAYAYEQQFAQRGAMQVGPFFQLPPLTNRTLRALTSSPNPTNSPTPPRRAPPRRRPRCPRRPQSLPLLLTPPRPTWTWPSRRPTDTNRTATMR